MREIVLDTETTGLEPGEGHRIVEIGAVELHNHLPTGRTYHQYINPQRDMPTEAFEVHGLAQEFLADKPVFADIGRAFLDFVGDAKLVIHNAAFDIKFLDAELKWANFPLLGIGRAIDTLDIARRKHPGAQNSLDALCRRYGVDNSNRELHGALLDSELLAQVYLELVGGRQPDFALGVVPKSASSTSPDTAADYTPPPRPRPLASRLSSAEASAHAEFIAGLGAPSLWKA
ncbi:MAG: DNA polymerase III subunit epsilon [Pseudomonadota bacterium]